MYSMIRISYTQTKQQKVVPNDNKIHVCGFELIPINNLPFGPIISQNESVNLFHFVGDSMVN
jgi:hypothetical protein